MRPKRSRDDDDPTDQPPPPKRGRHRPDATTDRISLLSDELLVRVLSFLSVPHLLAVSLVSHRFGRLACDSQLWKALYYGRFVLPRAMRIPGFDRVSTDNRLHYAGRRALWADGRRGGVVDEKTLETERVDWKRQFKIRHNWSRGKCAVEELSLGEPAGLEPSSKRKMLAKVVEGIAITADEVCGLRAWDLKSKAILAQAPLPSSGGAGEDRAATPTCIAVDDRGLEDKTLDLVVGFQDGSFGAWRLRTKSETTTTTTTIDLKYRHQQSSNGPLISLAYSHPYLLTANEGVTISLYTFDGPPSTPILNIPNLPGSKTNTGSWNAPRLLTSLKSHTSTPPLALAIRQAGPTTIASIAYTFNTVQGWSIGIQDLHVKTPKPGQMPEIACTRLAYTSPVPAKQQQQQHHHHHHHRRRRRRPSGDPSHPENSQQEPVVSEAAAVGPTTLCYTHPYLLATLPDNTLLLHLCTATATSLSVSPGIRLWGHTSGISDAEITSRGRAVSVSRRGDEMRVWELEGGGGGGGGRRQRAGDSRSVEIRAVKGGDGAENAAKASWEDDRRDWVGFDDEMVIVLKERRGGGDSLMVYDFT